MAGLCSSALPHPVSRLLRSLVGTESATDSKVSEEQMYAIAKALQEHKRSKKHKKEKLKKKSSETDRKRSKKKKKTDEKSSRKGKRTSRGDTGPSDEVSDDLK